MSAEVKAGAKAGSAEAGAFAKVGGVGGLVGGGLILLNIYFAVGSYKEGTQAKAVLPAGPADGLAVGSTGEGVLNAAGTLAGAPNVGTAMREAGQLGSAVHEPKKLWDAIKSGASPTTIGMGIFMGAFR